MALEVFNNSKNIEEVYGDSSMDASGNTTGIVKLEDGTEVQIKYSSEDAGVSYPNHSIVNTTSENGNLLDIFKAGATTSKGTLTYPFNATNYDRLSLTNQETKFSKEDGFVTTTSAHAVYNHCLHINLGLKEREQVDIGLTKNLSEATVVVNERMYKYKYSGYYDLTEEKTESLKQDVYVGNAGDKIAYTLGLYRSDYYYRAEMYSGDKDLYSALKDFYKTLNTHSENNSVYDTEMDVYLTYKIKLKNSSSAYDVKINSLDDYYDSSLSLVKVDEYKYLKTKTIAGKEENVTAEELVAKASDYSDNWNTVRYGIIGSDKDANGENIKYNKMTANGLDITLKPGEEKELTLTFRVNKTSDISEDNGKTVRAEDSIILGQKCNVAEIANYTTYYKDTTDLAGRIDRDSAPGNVNIEQHNDKTWYEDDTFAAPRMKLELISSNYDRKINGLVWEDNSDKDNVDTPGYNQKVGDGIKNGSEQIIKNLTTELVEKVIVKNKDGEEYTQYDYIWPTEITLDCLGGVSMEDLTGLDTTILTDENGRYAFNDVITGDYVVRFVYGDKNDDRGDDYKIQSANYSTAQYYNGEDYKSSQFKSILKDGATEIQSDSYLELKELLNVASVDKDNKNAAVDSEVRRLEVVALSRELNNENTTLMQEYAEKLFTDYYMYADTPKLDMNIEHHDYNGAGENSNTTQEYKINNVDGAIEERPMTQLTLDKQIEEIILTTSDNKDIMHAIYDIKYENDKVDSDGNITATVELNPNSMGVDNLQALNRDNATNNGFRYINVDKDILEGTTITVKYRFTVLNTGEVDSTGELANMYYINDNTQIKNARDELSTKLATYKLNANTLVNAEKEGYYIGKIYYYGSRNKFDDGSNGGDKVVTTTTRQVIDYIDNDVVFDQTLNNTSNMSWASVLEDELVTNKIITETIIDSNEHKILDESGVQYTTDNRSNLALSVDSPDDTKLNNDSTLNNKDFIVQLIPVEASKALDIPWNSSMALTITKYVDSQSDDLKIDNITEIVKYNNKVGRRDELTVAGNQIPANAFETKAPTTGSVPTPVSDTMKYERDTSVTEVITLSPPQGAELSTWKLQILGATLGGLTILAVGIVVIKKKFLK